MRCHAALDQLARPGGPDPVVAPALESHLAACPACRLAAGRLTTSVEGWRAATLAATPPAPGAAWEPIRSAIQAPVAAPRSRLAAGWIPAAATLAAAAAVVLLLLRPTPPPVDPSGTTMVAALAAHDAPEPTVEWVTTSDAGAAPVVFVDADSGWVVVWALSAEPL